MKYNLLYAIVIIIIAILLYSYFNNIQEGIENKNDEGDWKETVEAWKTSFKQLFKQIQENDKNIQVLKTNCDKYQNIYDCLEYRRNALMKKETRQDDGANKKYEQRKIKAKSNIKKLRSILKD